MKCQYDVLSYGDAILVVFRAYCNLKNPDVFKVTFD